MNFLVPYEHRNASGIYKIINTVNGKFYIGSSVSFSARFRIHKHDLLKNKHHSDALQKAVNKYGIDNFSMELIEVCETDLLLIREQHHLNAYDAYKVGYNCTPTAGSNLGRKASAETKQRISKAKKGVKYPNRKVSDEGKIKMSIAKTGVKTGPRSKEFGERISKLLTGRKLSQSHIDAVRAGKKKAFENGLVPKHCKPVNQYDLNGNFIKEWPSVQHALKAGFFNIWEAVNGKRKKASGYQWKYADKISIILIFIVCNF